MHEIDIKNRQAVLTEATNTNNSKELGGLPINSIFEKIRNVNNFPEKSQKTSTSRASIDVDLDEKTTARAQTIVSDKKRSVKEVWDETLESIKAGSVKSWIEAQIELTDEQAGILLAGRNVDEVLQGEVQRARSAKGAKAA